MTLPLYTPREKGVSSAGRAASLDKIALSIYNFAGTLVAATVSFGCIVNGCAVLYRAAIISLILEVRHGFVREVP